jgi:hypothetical protein
MDWKDWYEGKDGKSKPGWDDEVKGVSRNLQI